MIIVADSSPFVVLVSVDHVEVLANVFNDVIIPPQVQAELASPKRSEAVRAFIAAPLSWLSIVSPTSIEYIVGRCVRESKTNRFLDQSEVS
jgi:predicted nucleic acid-binding protein